MKTIEKEGKSTSSIISNFMKENNLKLEDFKFEVIQEGSKGFLSLFGTKTTKVQFFILDTKEELIKFTKNILNLMDIKFSSIQVITGDNIFFIDIQGVDNPGSLIGKSAKLLDSIQYIINQMINKKEKKQLFVKVDVNGYRERRKNALIKKVKSISEKVKTKGKSITLEPLHASNRRIVHKFIEKDKYLKTMTIGKGDYKRIVILPINKKYEKKHNLKSHNH